MKQTLIITLMLASNALITQAQPIDFAKVKSADYQLSDVMEITDNTFLVAKLNQVELAYTQNATEINF
jgi:hypothetical protein